MGRRAADGDSAAIAAALSDEEQAALELLERHLGLARGSWPRVPPLRELGESLAWIRLTARLVGSGRFTRSAALLEAAVQLALSGEGLMRRVARWQFAARAATGPEDIPADMS